MHSNAILLAFFGGYLSLPSWYTSHIFPTVSASTLVVKGPRSKRFAVPKSMSFTFPSYHEVRLFKPFSSRTKNPTEMNPGKFYKAFEFEFFEDQQKNQTNNLWILDISTKPNKLRVFLVPRTLFFKQNKTSNISSNQ